MNTELCSGHLEDVLYFGGRRCPLSILEVRHQKDDVFEIKIGVFTPVEYRLAVKWLDRFWKAGGKVKSIAVRHPEMAMRAVHRIILTCVKLNRSRRSHWNFVLTARGAR
jgi:hypothetical protein